MCKNGRKCNESVNNVFKIMRENNSLHQIVRQDSLHFDSIMNPINESVSVTWAIAHCLEN